MPELEQPKTGGLTALGVISVLLGSLWIIASAWALLQPATIQADTADANAPQLLAGTGVSMAYADAAMNLVLAPLLFVAGVGLLKLRTWGAKLASWYAIARITWSLIALAIALTGPFANRPKPETVSPEYTRTMETLFTPIALTEMVGALVLSASFAVILLCLLSRKAYKDNLA